MLTRLEIDNFRCFEGFVWEPASKQLILGANGCGKSSMMDALTNLRRFVAGDAKVDELFPLRERTKWLNRAEQRFGLQAEIDGVRYCYRLVVGASGSPVKPVVQLESLDCGNGTQSVRFEGGHVTLDGGGLESNAFGSPNTLQSSYRLDSSRSALSSLGDSETTDLAHRFRRWLNSVRCFRLNPFSICGCSAKEDSDPKVDLSNFADWYRWLDPRVDRVLRDEFFKNLGETLQGFDSLVLQDAGRDVKSLDVRFRRKDGTLTEYGFEELSEGQRCLICLYAIIHFVLAGGGTVIIDEPENFVSLREIQPWWITAENVVEDARGQLILASHHPEFIDQWAPPYGVKFVRDGDGPVRIKPWIGDPGSMLSAAQLVARGWDDD